MAGKRKYITREPEPTDEPVVERPKMQIMKPYIDTITKDTVKRDIDAGKLPKSIKIRFKMSGTGERSNRYLGRSGIRYDFNGGVPLVITNESDRIELILKAKRNPECWEIVN
jgi:hypothetical protein